MSLTAPASRPARATPYSGRAAHEGADSPQAGEYVLLVAAGALAALAFPPWSVIPFVLAAPGALAWVVQRRVARGAGAWASARAGAVLGGAFALVVVHWIVPALRGDYGSATAVVALAVAAATGGLFVGCCAALLHLLRLGRLALPLPLAAAVAWTAGEALLVRAGDLGFPWTPLGQVLAAWRTLAQAADLGGVRLLTFALALAGGLLAAAVGTRGRRRCAATLVAAAAGVLAALFMYGRWRERAIAQAVDGTPSIPVLVVEPGVTSEEGRRAGREREWVGRAMAQTRAATGPGVPPPALVLWPESTLRGFLQEFPEWRDSLRAAVRAAGAPVLTGGMDLEVRRGGRFAFYNAGLLTDAAGELDPTRVYRKQRLVPLVEAIPYVRLLPFVRAEAYGFAASGRRPPLTVADAPGAQGRALRLGVLVCYESAFGDLARAARADGADVIVVLTNDAWFGRSAGVAQHLSHLVLRAIETRAAVVQAANSGPSAWVDPTGRMHDATAPLSRGAWRFAIRTLYTPTPYVRAGDWIGWGCLATALLVAAVGARGGRHYRGVR